MGSAKGSALEWALALLRAPGERHALRQRALPDGMDRLLGIAAGAMPDALADAARSFGESEARVREAAQFYAREVLFFPQADAYRVLGVDPAADAGQIKDHYRLLQHWLHPDRLRNEDDAVFAARVNGAWNCLRSPERRHRYDEARQQVRPPGEFDGNGALRSMHAWVAEGAPPPERWRNRLPLLLLTATCLLLVLLVLRDRGRGPKVWELPERQDAASPMTGDDLGISVPRHEAGEAPAAVAAHNKRSPPRMRADAIEPRPIPKAALAMPRRTVIPLASPVVSPGATPPSPPVASPMPTSEVAVETRTVALPVIEGNWLQHDQSRPTPQASMPTFARIQSARQVGEQFLHYMGGTSQPPPPIWNSPAIQASADRMRQGLHHEGRARLAQPQWRIGNEAAVLTSGYAERGSDAESGRLSADLIWREGRWLVAGVSMERAR